MQSTSYKRLIFVILALVCSMMGIQTDVSQLSEPLCHRRLVLKQGYLNGHHVAEII